MESPTGQAAPSQRLHLKGYVGPCRDQWLQAIGLCMGKGVCLILYSLQE